MPRTAKSQTKNVHTEKVVPPKHKGLPPPPPPKSISSITSPEKPNTKQSEERVLELITTVDGDGNTSIITAYVSRNRTFRGQKRVDYTEPTGNGQYKQKLFHYKRYGYHSIDDDDDSNNSTNDKPDSAATTMTDKQQPLYNHAGFKNKKNNKGKEKEEGKGKGKKMPKAKNDADGNGEKNKKKKKAVLFEQKQESKAGDVLTKTSVLETIIEVEEPAEEPAEPLLPTKKTPKKKTYKKQNMKKKKAATTTPTTTTIASAKQKAAPKKNTPAKKVTV